MTKTHEETITQVRNQLGVCRGLLCVAFDVEDLDEVINLIEDAMASLEKLIEKWEG